MKIFMWAASMTDGTFWYRLHLPAEALRARGHEVQVSNVVGVWARDEAQIIVGQRVCNPRSAIMWRELAAEGRWRMVYEIDDNLLAIDPRTNDLAAVGQRGQEIVSAAREIGAKAAEDIDQAPARLSTHPLRMQVKNRSERRRSTRDDDLPANADAPGMHGIPQAVPYLERTDPGKVQPFRNFRSPDVQRAMREAIGLADLVTVTVPQLAEALSPYNPHAAVLPNSVPASLLDIEPRRQPLAGRVVLGWQGSQTHTDDWLVAADAVREVLWDHEHTAHMRFVGNAHPVGMRRNQVSMLEWTTDLWEHYRRVSRFHIGLAPLRNTTFNASKSPLRAVEMMALGVPGVYSRVPTYEAVVEHGVTGFLARTPAEWYEYLDLLIASPSLRAEMGDAARQAARAWTIEERVTLWEQAYEGLLS